MHNWNVKHERQQNGKVLTEDNEVKERWKESFEDLFNKPSPEDTSILQSIPTIPEVDKNQISCWMKFTKPLDTRATVQSISVQSISEHSQIWLSVGDPCCVWRMVPLQRGKLMG